MNIKYNRLFNISIAHNFFESNVNSNLSIRPDFETRKLLANGKLLFKKLGNNNLVLFKTDANQTDPFIHLGTDVRFRFYITTENSSEFFNITKLDGYSAGNKLYFTNNPAAPQSSSDAPEVLNYALIDEAFGKLFTYSYTLPGNQTNVTANFRIENSAGNTVSPGKDANGDPLDLIIPLTRDDSRVFSQQVDLRDKPSGFYTIFLDNLNGTINLDTLTVFIDNDGLDSGVLGVVDINYTAQNTIYADTDYFQLHFERKTTVWKYYIINKSQGIDFNTTVLRIEDSDPVNGDPYAHIDFLLEGAQPNANTQVKGFETVIFKSDGSIPSFEQPKLNVHLLDNNNKEIVQHLPNPPVNAVEKDNSGTIEKEIFVFI